MANPNTPRGLVPYAYTWGAPYNGSVNVYYVPVGNATALYVGDPVLLVSNTADANGIPTAEIAAAGGGTYITGVFMGVANNAGQLTIPVLQSNSVYLPASKAAYIYVADDPNLLHMVQEDSDGGAMVAGAGGRNADLVAGAGSTVTGLSGWMLDSSTLQTTNTLQMRVERLLQQADNAVGLYAKWLCRINLSSARNLTGI
jgi:hypothetical protein